MIRDGFLGVLELIDYQLNEENHCRKSDKNGKSVVGPLNVYYGHGLGLGDRLSGWTEDGSRPPLNLELVENTALFDSCHPEETTQRYVSMMKIDVILREINE